MVEQRPTVSDETRYRLLRFLSDHPEASQRELALHLGVSVGKVNYCLKALISKGLLKIRNFRSRAHKLAYAYVLTPRGVEEKAQVTYRFLKTKIAEYDSVSREIERLTKELREEQHAGGEGTRTRR
jgi:MarR family transcriptional regulator, temperature-dependent positive regulator of motility